MSVIIPITLGIGLVAGLGALVKWRWEQSRPSGFKKRRVLTSTEQTLYWRLVKMLPDHVVLPQVPLTRCVVVKGPAWQKLRREKMDFVICNRSMQAVAAIQLISEEEEDSRQHHEVENLKEEACDATGLQLLRWPENPVPSEAFISMELNNHSCFETRLVA